MATLDITWDDLEYKLRPKLIEALKTEMGFTKVMPVQKSVIPIFSKNYDVAVEVAPIQFNPLGCHRLRKDPGLCAPRY